MKQVFVTVGAALSCVLALFLVGGLVLPNHWNVERSVLVHAPKSEIHQWVGDLKKWAEWESLRPADLTLQYVYSEPSNAVGATRSYRGKHAGHGSTTLTQSDPDSGVRFESRVNSETPTAQGSLTYETQGASTRVIWQDRGQLPPIIGGYLRDSVEQGLTDHMDRALQALKQVAESRAPQPQ